MLSLESNCCRKINTEGEFMIMYILCKWTEDFNKVLIVWAWVRIKHCRKKLAYNFEILEEEEFQQYRN